MNIQLLSLFQGKSQVLWREKKKIIWGEKDKKKAFIYTKKIQQVYGIKNQKIWHYVKPGHLAVSRSGNLLLP